MWGFIEHLSFSFLAQSNISTQQNFNVTIALIAGFAQIAGTILAFQQSKKHPIRNILFIAFCLAAVITIASIWLPFLSFSFTTIVFFCLLLLYVGSIAYLSWRFRREYIYDNPSLTATKAYEKHLRAAINSLPQTNDISTIRRAVRTVFKGMEDVIFRDAGNVKFDITLLKPLENGDLEVIEQSDNLTHDTRAIMGNRFKWKPNMHGVAGFVAAQNETVLVKDLSVKKDRERYRWTVIKKSDGDPTGSLLVIPIVDFTEYNRCIAVLSITCSRENVLNEEHEKKIALLFADKLATLTLLDTFIQKHL